MKTRKQIYLEEIKYKIEDIKLKKLTNNINFPSVVKKMSDERLFDESYIASIYISPNNVDILYIFIDTHYFGDGDDYVFTCNKELNISGKFTNTIGFINLIYNQLQIWSMFQSPEDKIPCFSVKAEYFSLYSLGKIDWEKINILEIVKEIEKMEVRPAS